MAKTQHNAKLLTGLAGASLLLGLVACSREPVPVVALPPALEAPRATQQEEASESKTAPELASVSDQVDDGWSAAAGLPQPLSEPLVDNMRIDFEYGTLFEFALDPDSAERQVTIEPIGTPLEVALESLASSLRKAGFEPAVGQAKTGPMNRLYRSVTEQKAWEIELVASSYPEPELAAHPGGTGSVAMHLRPAKGSEQEPDQ